MFLPQKTRPNNRGRTRIWARFLGGRKKKGSIYDKIWHDLL